MNKFELKALDSFSGFDHAFDLSSLEGLIDFSATDDDTEACVQPSKDCCRELFLKPTFWDTEKARLEYGA